jgi:hypothetical protein
MMRREDPEKLRMAVEIEKQRQELKKLGIENVKLAQ